MTTRTPEADTEWKYLNVLTWKDFKWVIHNIADSDWELILVRASTGIFVSDTQRTEE